MAYIPGPRAIRRTRRHAGPGCPSPALSPSSSPSCRSRQGDDDLLNLNSHYSIQSGYYPDFASKDCPVRRSFRHEVWIMPGSGQYVFVNLWSQPYGRPWTYAAVYDLVLRLRERTGIDFEPHHYRHTYATWRLRRGAGIETV